MKKALIIIDMQIMPFVWKDYGGKTLFKEQTLLNNTKLLIEKANKAKAPVYYIMYTENGESPRAEGQPLWQINPEIAPQIMNNVIVKYYADSFYETNLSDLLKTQGISNIVLCGIQTEYCVDTTCRSAFSHGFKVELASDCHSTFDSDILTAEQIISHHNSILTQFAQIKTVEEIDMH